MVKKIFCSFLLISIFSVNLFAKEDAYNKIAKELSEAAAFLTQPKVAIIPFSYTDQRKSEGGKIVAERLTTRLVKLKKLQIIERELLEKVLQELHLETTGIIDVETTKQLGKVLGVEAIITGTLVDIGDNLVEVNARVIKTQTAEVLTAASVEIEKIWSDVAIAPPRPGYPEPTPVVYKRKTEGFFHLFLGASSGKMDLIFENNYYNLGEGELSFDIDGGGVASYTSRPYKKISFEELETNASVPLGIRFGIFEKNLGFDFEMSFISKQLKRQKTTIILNDTKTYNFEFYVDDYLKVTTLNFSGDILVRFSDKSIQPYLGFGLGLSFNKVTSPYIYQYYYPGPVFRTPLDQTSLGFIVRIPIGMRIMIDKSTGIFGEYLFSVSTFSFDRDRANETDRITMSMGQILFGVGFGF